MELAADLPMLRARCRAVRAGAVQSPGQCREVCARRHHHPHPELAGRRLRLPAGRSTRATAFRRATWSTSSTSSIARRKAIRCAPGTGLGLAISRGFIEAMHGTITAANRTDRTGAVFTIRLPVPARHRAVGHRRMSAAPLKVLVIDDEPPIRKLLRMGLSTQGYEILEAPNGKTALELLGAEAGSDHPRSRPAGHAGARIAADDARAQRERADRGAVEPRRRGRQGAGARPRRRRLCDQAVRDGRAARPHARGAAPSAAGARRTADFPRRRSLRRPRAPHRQSWATRR